MQLTVNGQLRWFAGPLTVSKLLQELNITEQRVAVEVNETIIKRINFSSHQLQDGDSLEILNFVGGG